MFRSLQAMTLAVFLTFPSLPAIAQEEVLIWPEEVPDTTVSIGSIERQIFEQDGDLVIHLRVQDLELKVGDLVLALQLQDLPS